MFSETYNTIDSILSENLKTQLGITPGNNINFTIDGIDDLSFDKEETLPITHGLIFVYPNEQNAAQSAYSSECFPDRIIAYELVFFSFVTKDGLHQCRLKELNNEYYDFVWFRKINRVNAIIAKFLTILKLQPNRATLRSDLTQAVR